MAIWICTSPTSVKINSIENNGDGTFTDATTHAGKLTIQTGGPVVRLPMLITMDTWISMWRITLRMPRRTTFAVKSVVFTFIAVRMRIRRFMILFTRITEMAPSPICRFCTVPSDLIPQHGLGVTFGDYDADGDTDLYVANDQDPNFLFQNSGSDSFLEVALISGVCYNDMGKEEAGMGTDFGDYDNDGWLDLTVSNYQTETNTVYHNHDGTFFADNTITSGIAEVTHGYLGWGIKFFDYDNDGYQDIFVANGHLMDNIAVLEKHVTYPQRNLLFRNLGDGRFVNVMSETDGLALKKVSRGAAIGDYDNDGDLDILVTNCNQRPDLLQNVIGNRNNWIQIQVVGQSSNRSGIGAKIKVVTGTHVQYWEVQSGGSYLSFHDLRAHFGVGKAEQIDLLEIRWLSGHVDRGDTPLCQPEVSGSRRK